MAKRGARGRGVRTGKGRETGVFVLFIARNKLQSVFGFCLFFVRLCAMRTFRVLRVHTARAFVLACTAGPCGDEPLYV